MSGSAQGVDVAVVGRGVIGSAAARHLAEAGRSVALIGPDEPADRKSSPGPFSSHPDEGRVTRIAGDDEFWVHVAAESVLRYPDIEARSGVRFHTPRGLVASLIDAEDWVARAAPFGSDARMVDPDWVRATTGIALPADTPVYAEGPPAGWVNPRRMVAAQTRLVELAGGHVIRDAATSVRASPDGVEVDGPFGSVHASTVLIATGAFGAELIGQTLDVDRRAHTVLMAEVDDDQRIPSLIVDGPADDRLELIYWVPPVPYPDGRIRLKIGGERERYATLEPGELVSWFHTNGDDIEVEALENSLRALLPDATFGDLARSPCVTTATPSGHPYIGWLDDRVALAIGGNGAAAKSGDELGRIAASLFDDEGWDCPFDRAMFTPQTVS